MTLSELTKAIAGARERVRDDIEAIRQIGFWPWLWYRTGYRPLMRLSHRFNWHHTKRLGPFEDGTQQEWCQWCGLRHVTYDGRALVHAIDRAIEGER